MKTVKSLQLINFIIPLTLCLVNCNQKNDFEFSEIRLNRIENFDSNFVNYCNLNLNTNFELNAVVCSFYGDYLNSIDQAAKRKSISNNPRESIVIHSPSNDDLINSLESILQDKGAEEDDKIAAKTMLGLLNTPDAKDLMIKAKSIPAKDFIAKKSKDYHFTLINEAHWNSQHRSFTKSLLKPLWDYGYRYLALETLSHEDTLIHERGYPVTSTGYYTKDSNFGNLVREALRIGYNLIPYETQNNVDGTLRDRDQAMTIVTESFKKDSIGKVLIHAGYSHINETGDSNYEPMGYQLKKLISQDILTIDQESMTAYTDVSKQHDYYRESDKKFGFEEPTILLDSENKVIIKPLFTDRIDIQVYHPKTSFIKRRQDWKFESNVKSIPLSGEFKKYKNHLIQAVKRGESNDAIPVDQFVISNETILLLHSGKYDIRIINCGGDMVASSELVVN